MTGKHGMYYTSTYGIWRTMLSRCHNPNARSYCYYGGRGISVCPQWRTFDGFFADMGERPAGLTLDRIDPRGNYEPGNCRWVDMKTQQRNRTNNRPISFAGRVATEPEWAELLGVRPGLIKLRLWRGWSAERALTTSPCDAMRCRLALLKEF